LQQQFQEWYADKIYEQLDGRGEMVLVELRLSVVKPLGVKWMMKLFDYPKSKTEIIQNGLKGAGITDCLTNSVQTFILIPICTHQFLVFIHMEIK